MHSWSCDQCWPNQPVLWPTSPRAPLRPRLARRTSERHDHTAHGLGSTFRLLTNQPDDHAHLPPRSHSRPTHTQNTHAPPPPKPHTTPNQTPNHTTKPNPTTKPTTTKTKNISTRVRISREEGGGKGERKREEKGKGKKKRRGKKRKISAHGFEPRTAYPAKTLHCNYPLDPSRYPPTKPTHLPRLQLELQLLPRLDIQFRCTLSLTFEGPAVGALCVLGRRPGSLRR